jgi:hypothetical protein
MTRELEGRGEGEERDWWGMGGGEALPPAVMHQRWLKEPGGWKQGCRDSRRKGRRELQR